MAVVRGEGGGSGALRAEYKVGPAAFVKVTIAAKDASAAEQLKALLVKIPAKAGTGGRLFGAVTTKEISDALKAQHNVDIPKQKLVLDDPIKAFGTYQVKARLGYEISGTVNVLVCEEK